MDMHEFEGKWKEIRSQSKIWWRRITDSDLNKVERAEVKYFEFVTRLQLRYELDRKVTKDIIDRRMARYTASLEVARA